MRRERETVTLKGFTLIEIIVVLAIISILVGVTAPLVSQSLKAEAERETIEQMKAIHKAIVGDPELGYFGFLGDIGDFPTALSDLVSKPVGLEEFKFYTNNVGYGWRGPYLDLEFEDLEDGWGNAFQYSTADGLPEGQIKSAGPDKVFGTSDDIVFPFLPSGEKVEKNATLLITVQVDDTNQPANIQGGGIPNPEKSKIKVYYAFNGEAEELEQEAEGTAFDGIGFIFTVHHGLHAVELTFVNDGGTTTTNLFTVEVIGGVQSNIVFRHPQDGTIIP